MKPILYDKTGKTQLGVLEHCINCFTEEERNGGFTLTLTYPITDELHKDLIYDNIIVVKANDEYDNQQFRIAATERIIKGTVTVKAVHISYDLVYDLVQNVSFEKESCEYALNQLFRNSHFSKHYRGYSNIVNAQKYSANNKNIWEAIVGSTGSIIDTYGKGPEIIRDNTNIHVLNKRGTDRGVVIEYSVNMLDEALEIDASSIVTSIYGFARYTDEENNEHTVNAPRVNSSLIDNYAHPFIISKDYTDRFEQGVVPTEAQVQSLVELDFQDGIDQPKCNYTVNFVPLSKCAGYEDIQDQIHLCDIVTIKDKRYNIDTKANVIKYKYNVLLERYDTMELGDARNTLTQTIVGSTQKDLEQKINDKTITLNDKSYPDTLPKTSVLTLHAGLGTIQVDWTYERQVYYSYQLYGSTQQGFTPTSADLLYEGQASSFLHTVAAGSTWYFRVRAKNTHGKFNEFSDEAGITCFIIDENTTYIEKGAIQDAYIGTLNLDRGWVGELKGHWIDARNLTVTDGNGVRTLDIDSFGNIYMYPTQLKVLAENTEIDVGNEIAWHAKQISRIDVKADSIISSVATKVGAEEVSSIIRQSSNDVQIGFNGINDRININPQYMAFTATNGNKDMLLYGGQVCIYNNMDNTFMSTMGSILNGNNTLKGVGFILGVNTTNFMIQRDSDWDDILTNRAPNPAPYFNIDFAKNTTTIAGTVQCSNLNLLSGNITNVTTGKIMDFYSYGFYAHNTGNQMFRTNGYDMFNGANWDWQGHNILNPIIIGGTVTSASYGMNAITESTSITTLSLDDEQVIEVQEKNTEDKSIIDQIDVLEFQTYARNSSTQLVLDVSNVSNKESILVDEQNVDLGKLVTLLIKEVQDLKAEIKELKEK